mmetsp:Transcript_21445/g.74018  ORF Transcript_21445/g.74018 Transcript_21445/m.74018 type:complete len:209 (+) Transcript_21445:84-710(+)
MSMRHWSKRKTSMIMRPVRQDQPLKKRLTPCSLRSFAAVSRTPRYLAPATSPCWFVLIVSMGWVEVATTTPQPTAAMTFADASSWPRARRPRLITGPMPSMPAVKMPSRPHDMARPRPKRPATPASATTLAGVARSDVPKRCCWMSTSSIGAHAKPLSAPPMRPAPTSSPSLSLRGTPPVKRPWHVAVRGSCSPESTDMFTIDMPVPR